MDYNVLFWFVPAASVLALSFAAYFYKQMKADKVLTTSMIMRGVKFIGVAALMVVYVKLGLAGKIHFLLYTLIYYILTSACETWLVRVYNQTKGKE